MNIEHIHKVAVVGTGIMGTGIALAFARGGYQVAAFDAMPEILDRARETAAADCRGMVASGILRSEEMAGILARVTFTSDWDAAMAGADYVTEAVPCVLEIKQSVFNRCGETCSPNTIVASTTSSMSITDIAAGMTGPERAIVAHWFIPPHLTTVVEVVPGKGTSEQTVKATTALLATIGKKPVIIKENPGFVHNFIQLAMERAAISLVEKGVCSAEDVDAVVQNGFPSRLAKLGPMRSLDYAGLDTALHVLKNLYEKTGDATFKPPAILEEKVAKGELGMKSGKGFYEYTPEEAEKVRTLANDAAIKAAKG